MVQVQLYTFSYKKALFRPDTNFTRPSVVTVATNLTCAYIALKRKKKTTQKKKIYMKFWLDPAGFHKLTKKRRVIII